MYLIFDNIKLLTAEVNNIDYYDIIFCWEALDPGILVD